VEGVGDMVQRIGDGRIGHLLSGWVIERSNDTVCGLHRAREDRKHEFFG
jgi:hypothetical protein